MSSTIFDCLKLSMSSLIMSFFIIPSTKHFKKSVPFTDSNDYLFASCLIRHYFSMVHFVDLTDGQKILNTNLRILFPSCFISLKRPDLPYILSPAFTLFIGTDLFNCLYSYESAKVGITPYANPCIAVYLCCN